MGWAQTRAIDSLKRVIATTKVDTTKAMSLIRLGEAYRGVGEYNKAMRKVTAGLKMAEVRKYDKGIAKAYDVIGTIFKNEGNFDRALTAFRKSLRIWNRINNAEGIAKAYNSMGSIYERYGNYPEALDLYKQSLQIREKINDLKGLAVSYNSLGNLYYKKSDLKMALDFYQKSQRYYEAIKFPDGLAVVYNNIGNIHESMGDHLKALAYYRKSLAIETKSNDLDGISKTYSNIGNVYYSLGQYDEALSYYQKTEEIQQKLGDMAELAGSWASISTSYLQLNQPKKAREYALKSFEGAQNVKHLEIMAIAAADVSEADSALGDFASAYRYYQLYKRFSDSLSSESNAKEIGKLESKYQYENQIQKQNDLLEQQAQQRRLFYILVGILILVLMTGSSLLFIRYRVKSRINRILNEKNQRIASQKAQLEKAYEELNTTLDQIQLQKEEIEHKNLKIEDSIRYAYQIQMAILPDPAFLESHLPPHFIFYQPKDIVSGDFYWVAVRDELLFFCVADCTGHGVPGAFMSVVGSNALHATINEAGFTQPDAILRELDQKIKTTLHQDTDPDSKDGMDIALCVWDTNQRKLYFAGAGRPLYLMRSGTFTEIKGDKYAIGGGQTEQKSFTTHNFTLQKGDRIFLFTDGITDQFGGKELKKFTSKRLQQFIKEYHHLPIREQGDRFAELMRSWMNVHSQIDDLTLFALEV
jgi:serine phosphatase RsbU (regulator of sigma subunit)